MEEGFELVVGVEQAGEGGEGAGVGLGVGTGEALEGVEGEFNGDFEPVDGLGVQGVGRGGGALGAGGAGGGVGVHG